MKLSLVQINKHQGNETFYLRSYDKKTRKTSYRSLHTTSRIEAERILAKETAKNYGNTNATAPTIRNTLDSFFDTVEIRKGSARTLSNYRTQLEPLEDFFKAKRIKVITDFTPEDANAFIAQFKEHKSSTITQRIKCCRLLFKWAKKIWKLQIENPFSEIRMPRTRSKEKSFWKPEQIKAIIEATHKPDMRFLFSLMAYAGLRFFEAQKVSWSDFSGEFLKVWGKGEKFAKLPISNKLKNEIQKYLNGKEQPSEGEIFTDKLTNTLANRAVKNSCILAGIKFEGVANCHRFRHSFASNLIGAGASVVSVQRLMRHSTAAITLSVYSHILKEDLNKDVELI